MTASRRVQADPVDIVRAAVPLLLVLGAAALPGVAGISLLLLVGGVVVAIGRRAPVAWAWAAGVPASALLALRAFGPAVAPWEQAGCTSTTSPAVLWAIGEAALVVALVVGLAGALGGRPVDLGLRRPPKYAWRWSLWGAAVLLAGGLAAVILLARPLFGAPELRLDGIAFVLPALLFAIASGVAEELAWRGALQGWLARTLGQWLAVWPQAALSGVAWGVALGSPLAGLVAGTAGVVLGATVVRTRSLAVAIAWHVAFNVPLFMLVACRAV